MRAVVSVPEGVSVELNNNTLKSTGSFGSVVKEFKTKLVNFSLEDNSVVLETKNDRKNSYAQMNAAKSIVSNMLSGVQKKYKYKLSIIYSHFPMTIAMKGNELHINNFLGERKPRVVKIKDNVKVNIKGKSIEVESVDKEQAGIVAGLIEKTTIVRNRDRRVYQDGIYIVEKGVQDE